MTDPSTNALIAAARCYDCYPAPIQAEVQTYVLARIAGVSTDPNELASLAKCMTCLSPATLLYARIYLLATIGHLPTESTSLLEAAKCYECVPEGMLQSIDTYKIVHDTNSPSNDIAALSRLARCLGCLSTPTLLEVQVYLLATIAGVTTDPDELAALLCGVSCIPAAYVNFVTTTVIVIVEDNGGISGCTDVPADLIPVMTVNYVAGVASTIDVLLTKVCCAPGSVVLYESDNADMTGSTDFDIIPVTGSPGEDNFQMVGIDVSAATKAYLAVKQHCLVGLVSDYSNIEVRSNTLLVTLISYWKLEENENSDRADSAGSNPLSRTANSIGAAPALIGNGADYDAFIDASKALYHVSNADFVLAAGQSMTFSLWIKPSAWAANRGILGKFGAAHEYLLWQTVASQFAWVVADGGGTGQSITIAQPSLNNWHHIVVGYDSGTSQAFMYVDNGARQNVACVGVNPTAAAFQIGNYSSAPAYPFQGLIDEVGFWKRVLSAAEVNKLYNVGAGLSYPF